MSHLLLLCSIIITFPSGKCPPTDHYFHNNNNNNNTTTKRNFEAAFDDQCSKHVTLLLDLMEWKHAGWLISSLVSQENYSFF